MRLHAADHLLEKYKDAFQKRHERALSDEPATSVAAQEKLSIG